MPRAAKRAVNPLQSGSVKLPFREASAEDPVSLCPAGLTLNGSGTTGPPGSSGSAVPPSVGSAGSGSTAEPNRPTRTRMLPVAAKRKPRKCVLRSSNVICSMPGITDPVPVPPPVPARRTVPKPPVRFSSLHESVSKKPVRTICSTSLRPVIARLITAREHLIQQ
jgi:hypothetical protein